jgi:hypothetical protein
MIYVSKFWFFDPRVGCFKPFDLAYACEAKAMLAKELHAKFEDELNEKNIFLFFWISPFVPCSSFHQYKHKSDFLGFIHIFIFM